MLTQIEIASGEILNLIEEKKRPVSISEIESHLESEKEFINTTIDWLVQERHVHLINHGSDKYLCKC